LRKGPLNLILQVNTAKGYWDKIAARYPLAFIIIIMALPDTPETLQAILFN
jgi:hypothetical protein